MGNVPDPVSDLVLVEAAMVATHAGSPVALAAARALLDARDIGEDELGFRLATRRRELLEQAAVAAGQDPAAVEDPLAGLSFEGPQFLRRGDSGPHIGAMQRRLTELGHPTPDNDIYDDGTRQQVSSYQKKYGLPATGHVDPVTLEFIRTPPQLTHGESQHELRTARGASAVGPGSFGPPVEELQSHLSSMGHELTDQPGEYGRSTESAIRKLQSEHGFAPTGRADEQTIALLGRLRGDSERAVEQKKAERQKRKQEGGAVKKDGKTKAQEASYAGNPSVPDSPSSMTRIPWGGTTPMEARIAQALGLAPAMPPRPPNLREADPKAFAACASCVFYEGGSAGCGKYDHYPVARGDVCDDWKTLTPEDAQHDQGDYEGELGEAKLSAEARKKLPKSAFAIPEEEAYPIHDEAHARNALSRVSQHGTPAEKKRVRAAVKRRYPNIGAEEALHEGRMRESELELDEVKSSAYPGLDRSPKENWVDKAGGLPSYIERIAKHLHYEKGKEIGTAIAIAVNTVKRWCAGGGVTKTGPHKSNVSAKTKAQACAAVAQWEAKKKASRARSATEAAEILEAVGIEYDEAELEAFRAAEALYEEAFKPIPPSLNWCRSILEEVEALYDDWDSWTDGRPPAAPETMVVFAQEDAVDGWDGKADPSLAPFVRGAVLHVAGVPMRVLESPSEGVIVEAAAKAFDARLRRMNKKQLSERAARQLHGLKGGLQKGGRRGVPRADKEVAAVVSKRFAGKFARPRTFATDVGSANPGSAAGGIEEARAVGLAAKFEERLHPRGHGGKWVKKLESMGFKRDYNHPFKAPDTVMKGHGLYVRQEHATGRLKVHRQGMAGEEVDLPGHMEADLPEQVKMVMGDSSGNAKMGEPGDASVPNWVKEMEGKATGQKKPASTSSDALSVDQAIGGVLANFPGLKDWELEPSGGDYLVHVELDSGKKHHFKVTADGDVVEVGEDGKATAAAEPAKAAAPASAGGYTLTGETEKAFHMENGQVYKGSDGKWYRKVQNTKMQGKNGPLAAVEIENLTDGTMKTAPAFALGTYYELATEGGGVDVPSGFPAPVPGKATAAKAASEDKLYGDLLKSVGGEPSGPTFGGEVASFDGLHVVVTGKIPGYTRKDVEAMLTAKGAKVHSSVGKGVDVLVTGTDVGKIKTDAAAKHGAKVVSWGDVEHLLEAELSPRLRRLLREHAAVAHGGPAEADGARARVRVLEGRLTVDERRQLLQTFPDRAAAAAVHS